jgi:hypothetical protein
MNAKKIAAVGAVALLPLVATSPAHAHTTYSKVFAHKYAYQAQVKCQNYQTDLRRAGRQVTAPCTYVPWGSEHGFVVTWR